MRKYFLLFIMNSFIMHGHAQSGKSKSPSRFFLKAYGGYGFFTPGSYRVKSVSSFYIVGPFNTTLDTTVQTQGTKGIGGGIRFGGGLGYVLNDFWTIGVDFEYQKGQKLTNSLNNKVNDYAYDSTSDEMHYNASTLTPYITFKAVAKPNFFLYNRLGIVVTLPFTLHQTGSSISSRPDHWPPVTTTDSSLAFLNYERATHSDSYKVSLGLGLNLAFGINYRLTDHVRVFAEVFGNFSALKPERSTITRVADLIAYGYTDNYDYNVDPPLYLGQQLVHREDVFQTKTNTTYQNGGSVGSVEESFAVTPGGISIVYKARDQRFQINMNSIGLNCGILVRF